MASHGQTSLERVPISKLASSKSVPGNRLADPALLGILAEQQMLEWVKNRTGKTPIL